MTLGTSTYQNPSDDFEHDLNNSPDVSGVMPKPCHEPIITVLSLTYYNREVRRKGSLEILGLLPYPYHDVYSGGKLSCYSDPGKN